MLTKNRFGLQAIKKLKNNLFVELIRKLEFGKNVRVEGDCPCPFLRAYSKTWKSL